MDPENNQKQRAIAISTFIEQQQNTYLSILHRTKKMLGMYLGYSKKNTSLAEGLMNEVFSDIIDGTRKWDMEKLKLEQVLRMNVKSEVYARVKKELRYLSTPVVSNGYDEEPGKTFDDLINTPPADIEGKIDADAIENYCCNVILKDDLDAQIVFNEMLTGKKQQQIAAYLGITVEQAEIIIRSIRRLISKQIPNHLIENIPKQLKLKILNQK